MANKKEKAQSTKIVLTKEDVWNRQCEFYSATDYFDENAPTDEYWHWLREMEHRGAE